jgi:hypothetical protein
LAGKEQKNEAKQKQLRGIIRLQLGHQHHGELPPSNECNA